MEKLTILVGCLVLFLPLPLLLIAPFMFVICLFLYILWLISCFYLSCFVCICSTLVSHLLHICLLWLALSAFAIYILSVPLAFAISWWFINSVCVFCSLLCLLLLSIPHPFCLRLLYFNELSTLFVFFMAFSVDIYYLYLFYFIFICCALISRLLRHRFLWLAPSASAICAFLTLLVSLILSFLL